MGQLCHFLQDTEDIGAGDTWRDTCLMLGPRMAELLLTKSHPGARENCIWRDRYSFPRNIRGVFETAFQSHCDSRLLEITGKTWSFPGHLRSLMTCLTASRKILQTIDWHSWKPELTDKNIWSTGTHKIIVTHLQMRLLFNSFLTAVAR